MYTSNQQPLLPDDPELRSVVTALLPLCGQPWTFDEMQQQWKVSQEQADQWEAALTEHGLLATLPDRCYTMPDTIRKALMLNLINAGDLERAQQILASWRQRAVQAGNLHAMAEAHLWLGNLLALTGNQEAALAECYCMLALYQAIDDMAGVASTAWMIGAYLANQSRLEQALPYLVRAAVLADQLGLRQARRYRDRLNQVTAQLK